ncbi:hypothetical protein KM1_061920 [Entamoeba histolytica HM-3:IMSS]|uniref:Proteasome activator complex subunit 4 C-terminal domain-containing protein n=2 Tax=Entamoeba histolytica TaxID=5759 RepID=M2S595_ENTHI|nr:Hypothetical protein EHI5A_036370 [Entamoeba histolytica KU27]EMS10980.1 hypothetical protein KM1_061920 [Entamoeba histolytica HM-3:IMSS]
MQQQKPDPIMQLWNCYLKEYVPIIPVLQEEIHEFIFRLNKELLKKDYISLKHVLNNFQEFLYSGIGLTDEEIRELVKFCFNGISDKYYYNKQQKAISLVIELVLSSAKVKGMFGVSDTELSSFTCSNDADQIFGRIHFRDHSEDTFKGLELDYRHAFKKVNNNSTELAFNSGFLVLHFKNFFKEEDAQEIMDRINLFSGVTNGLKKSFLVNTFMPSKAQHLYLRELMDQWESIYTSDAMDYFMMVMLTDVLTNQSDVNINENDIEFIFNRINHDLFYEFNGGDGILDGVDNPFKGLIVVKPDDDDFLTVASLLIISLIEHEEVHNDEISPVLLKLRIFFESVHRTIAGDNDGLYTVFVFLKGLVVYFLHEGLLDQLNKESIQHFVDTIFKTMKPMFFSEQLPQECKDIIRWLMCVDGKRVCKLVIEEYSQLINCKPDDHHLQTFLVVVSLFIEILPQLIEDNDQVAVDIVNLVFQLHRYNSTIPDVNSIVVDLIITLSKQFYLVDSPPHTVANDSIQRSIFFILPDLLVEYFASLISLMKDVSNLDVFPFTNEYYNALETLLHFESEHRKVIEERILLYLNDTTTLLDCMNVIIGILVYYSNSFVNKLMSLVLSKMCLQNGDQYSILNLSENELEYCLSLLYSTLSIRCNFKKYEKQLFIILDHFNVHPKEKIREQSIDCCKKICAIGGITFSLPLFKPTYPMRFENYYEMTPNAHEDPQIIIDKEFFQQVYDKYIYTYFNKLKEICLLSANELKNKRNEFYSIVDVLECFIEGASILYDIREHNVQLPNKYECIRKQLESQYERRIQWEDIGRIIITGAQRIRECFEDDNKIIEKYLKIIRIYIKKQSSSYEPSCISFLIHPSRRSFETKFPPIIYYEQATTLLFQLQGHIYDSLISPLDIDVFIEEELLAICISDPEFHNYANQSNFFKEENAKYIVQQLVSHLPTVITDQNVKPYIFGLKLISTYVGHLPMNDFPIFFDIFKHFITIHFKDPSVFSNTPLTTLFSQFQLVAESSPVFQLKEIPEEFLTLLYQGSEIHPLTHLFLQKFISAYLLTHNKLPNSFVEYCLKQLVAQAPLPKRYGLLLRNYIRHFGDHGNVVIVVRGNEDSPENIKKYEKYSKMLRHHVHVITENEILNGKIEDSQGHFVLNYTTKYQNVAAFLVDSVHYKFPDEQKELLKQFFFDRKLLKKYIENLSMITAEDIVSDEDEDEGKYISLNDYVLMLRFIQILGKEAFEVLIDIANEKLRRKTKEDYRCAIVLFQLCVEGLQSLNVNEIEPLKKELVTMFEDVLNQQYEDVYAYANRLHALFSGRSDPRITKEFIQVASKKQSILAEMFLLNISRIRLDIMPFAMKRFEEIVKNPTEQISECAITFASKSVINQMLYPQQMIGFLDYITRTVQELPINNEDVRTDEIALPSSYKIVSKVLFPNCDQSFIINNQYLPILFNIYDKLLTYAQTTHGVMNDVVETLENYSSIFLNKCAFELYLNKLYELMKKYSNAVNQFSILSRNFTVTICVHEFQITKNHIDRMLNFVFELLQSNQTQIRLITSDVLFTIIDIFHPIENVCNRIEQLRINAIKKDSNESQQHSYILAVLSLISTYKTEIPKFLVKVLVDFASTTFTIKSCITSKKNALLEFWESHKDMWDVYYAPLFTYDERILLKEGNTPQYIV